MKPTLPFIAAFLLCITFSQWAQAAARVGTPIDSLTKKALVKALDAFLLQKESDNDKNKFVLKEDRLATWALLDEMRGVEKNPRLKEIGYYKAYLSNIVDLTF